MATEISMFVRVVVGIVAVGGVALIGIVIKDRIKQVKEENLKEVDK